jgi:hypothetical protein
MTQEELDEFKLNSKKNYKKINLYIKNKCRTCREIYNKNCKSCDFNFSKFLMRSILPEKDGICRKCTKWLTDNCYNQGSKEKQCDDMNLK